MAATVTAVGTGTKESVPYFVREFDLTNLVSDETVTITHGGPAYPKPDYVEFEWRVPPTALCAATVYHIAASDSTTTVDLKVVAESGGDLSGATLRVRLKWYNSKAGGLTAS